MQQHDTETFGDRLRAVRRAQHMRATTLARAVGVTEAAIRSWESGRTEGPSLVVGLRIARALCEDPDYLAFGTDTPVRSLLDLERTVARLDAAVSALERH